MTQTQSAQESVAISDIMVAMAIVMSEKAAGWQPACASSPQLRLLTCPEWSSTRPDEVPERQCAGKFGFESCDIGRERVVQPC